MIDNINICLLYTSQGGFPSKGIEPEKEYKANFGVEVGLWKGLSMQVDAFYNRRKNIRQYAGGVYSSCLLYTSYPENR